MSATMSGLQYAAAAAGCLHAYLLCSVTSQTRQEQQIILQATITVIALSMLSI